MWVLRDRWKLKKRVIVGGKIGLGEKSGGIGLVLSELVVLLGRHTVVERVKLLLKASEVVVIFQFFVLVWELLHVI